MVPRAERAARGVFRTSGTWWPLNVSGGGRSASFGCPQCGVEGILDEHVIHNDGRVEPSVVCPSCGWHDYIKLADWPGEYGWQ